MRVGYDFDDMKREQGGEAIRRAMDAARFTYDREGGPDEYAEPAAKLAATPFVWRDERTIPPRQWLYGKHLLRKFLSVDVAAGGVGKSSVKIVEALSMTSGRALFARDLPEGPLRVWIYNLEDPAEETERRLHAALNHFGLCPTDVGDRLFVDSGRDQPVMVAEETPTGARIIRPVVDALISTLQERKIDVLILDPFVSSHAVSENDNRAIDMVAKEFGRVAEVCNCSINLIHHVRKQNGQEATADSARGASALIGAARSVVVYNRMTKEEGESAGIAPEQVGFHFRTQTDKANLAPPEAAEWFRMNNYELANGDHVGVACPWQWPDAFAGISTEKLKAVQRAVAEGEYRENVRSADWVGNIIARELAMDPESDKRRLGSIIKQWIRNDVLRVVERDDENRRSRKFVEVGAWVSE